MNSDAIKVKLGLLLCVPLLALGLAALYTALDWVLVEGTGWLALDRQVADYWIPVAIAGILALAVAGPRVRILKLSEKHNIAFLFTMVAIATVAAPTICAQFYLHAAAGTLVHVASAENIAEAPQARYYSADLICLDREHAAAQPVVAAGHNSPDLKVTLYVAVPLCVGRDVWIGLKYYDTIDGRLSDARKDAEYNAFVQRSNTALYAEDTTRYAYFERIGPGTDRRTFGKALARAGVTGAPIVLVPHAEPFEQRTGNLLAWTVGMFLAGTLTWFALVLIAPIDRHNVAHPRDVKKKEEDEPNFWRTFLIPSRHYWGLPLLLDANILVYVAMVLAGLGVATFQTDDLIAWGANYGPADHGLGLLRLFTSQFVHGGGMHIANNMYGLIFAALFLSPVAVNARLVLSYLLCGLGGSLASVSMHPDTVSVGASGAIFGLFGMLIALVTFGDARLAGARQMILVNGAIFVGLNLALGAATPGIDNAAHVGGLATGLVLGAVFFLLDRKAAGRPHRGADPEQRENGGHDQSPMSPGREE